MYASVLQFLMSTVISSYLQTYLLWLVETIFLNFSFHQSNTNRSSLRSNVKFYRTKKKFKNSWITYWLACGSCVRVLAKKLLTNILCVDVEDFSKKGASPQSVESRFVIFWRYFFSLLFFFVSEVILTEPLSDLNCRWKLTPCGHVIDSL